MNRCIICNTETEALSFCSLDCLIQRMRKLKEPESVIQNVIKRDRETNSLFS